MASLIEKGVGVYELRVSVGRDMITGRPRAVTKTFHGGKREAARALTAFAAEVQRTPGRSTSAGTVNSLVAAYIEDRAASISPSTLTLYRRSQTRIASTPLGSRRLSKVTAEDVDGAYRILRTTGLSEHTMRQVHQLLRSAFKQGIRWRTVAYNPVDDARPPKVPRKRVQAPSAEDVRRLTYKIAEMDPDLAGIVLLACSTGLRRGALHGLQWGDLEGATLVIRRSLTRVDRAVHVRPPKMRAKGEVESVALVDLELEILRQLRARQDGRRREAGLGLVGKGGWVLSDDGLGATPRRPDSMAGKMWRACDELGIRPRISPHDLRHFAATQMLAAGIPVDSVARRLHHADASMTLSVYSHPTEVDERRAGSAVAALMTDNESRAPKDPATLRD